MSDPSPTSVLTYTGGIASTNGYLVPAADGWIGVDAPEGFADWLAARDCKLQALLLTHAHFDHVMDAAEIAQAHGCPIYAWEHSTRASRLEDYLWQAAGMRLEVAEYAVDHLLAGVDAIHMAGTVWQLAHVPGHSLDSVVFMDAATQRAFTGDTLFQAGLGRTDFPGGSTPLLLKGIREKLLTLPDDTTIYPGHGGPSTIGAERGWVERER